MMNSTSEGVVINSMQGRSPPKQGGGRAWLLIALPVLQLWGGQRGGGETRGCMKGGLMKNRCEVCP